MYMGVAAMYGCGCAGHRRSTSHHNISREISLTELKLPRPGVATCAGLNGGSNICQTQREVDPEFFKVSQSVSQAVSAAHAMLHG